MDSTRPSLQVIGRDQAPETAPGERWDWSDAYRELAVPIYRFVYSRVGNRPDAEDITTQTFVQALPRLREGAAGAEVRSYVYTTARTVLADHWRARYDVQLRELPEDLPWQAPPANADEEAHARRANLVLSRLPDNYRRVLELRFLRGFSLRETAAAMKITVTNAKVLQHRALRRAAEISWEELP